jgi:hypothetical protein
MSTDAGSNYNVTKTTTFFRARHNEADTSATGLSYETANDLAQSTLFKFYLLIGNGNDENISGTLTLFNPSSTTYVKHFIARLHKVIIMLILLLIFYSWLWKYNVCS